MSSESSPGDNNENEHETPVPMCSLCSSTREREVVEMLAHGNTIPMTANRLCISENTVKTHVQRIYAKLGIHRKRELLELVDSQQV